MWLLQEADLSGPGLTITADRKTVVDFSVPFWEEPTVVLLKHSAKDTKLFSLFKPLHWMVWVVAVLHVLSAAAFIFLITWLRHHAVGTTSDPMASFWSCVWYSLGVWLQQGDAPHCSSLLAASSC